MIIFTDNEDPNITCPGNLTVNTDFGQNYSAVSLPAENSSADNSGVAPNITINVNGMTYYVGDNVTFDLMMSPHFVQYMASDNSMNNATCDMYINVTGM